MGSLAVSLTLMRADGKIAAQAYARHKGAAATTLSGMLRAHGAHTILNLVRTGSGSHRMPFPGAYVDATVAGLEGARHQVPDVRNVLSIGGGSFSLVELNAEGAYRRSTLNSACASGTGAFLDQQALRLQIPPADLPALARRWQGAPPMVATRCAVFAKSDMIHLQQEGFTTEAIAAGLCAGLGRATVEGLVGGRKLQGLTVIIGGVALNPVVVEAIREALATDLILVPERPETVGSIGAALLAGQDRLGGALSLADLADEADRADGAGKATAASIPLRAPLRLTRSSYPDVRWADAWEDEHGNEIAIVTPEKGLQTVALGLDVGSTSTKAVLLNAGNRVVGWVYRKTAGDPIRAVQHVFRAIEAIRQRGGFNIAIRGVGTTGSGRNMIGTLIGADLALNEISAHAEAALFLDPAIDTIIELGGQDAKFTQLQNGMVYNSVMNHVCAAGTGSFIEEQALKLGISLAAFADLAMDEKAPLTSDRCTVYMERDLDILLARGWSKGQVAAAVLHSVRDNYLNKVVGGLRIGTRVCFQGATARNRALVAAFETGLDRAIHVSPFCHLTGALGMALLVRRRIPANMRSLHFKGLGFAHQDIRIEQETCDLCRNACRLSLIHTSDGAVAWGLKCGRDYNNRRIRHVAIPGFEAWQQRERAWRGVTVSAPSVTKREAHHSRPCVALPRALGTYGYYPFWQAFLETLGCETIFPDATDARILAEGSGIATAEYCAPVIVSHGHARRLLANPAIDWLLVPHLIGETPPQGFTAAHFCPYVQAHPAVLKALRGLPRRDRILAPIVRFDAPPPIQARLLSAALAAPLHVKPSRIRRALRAGRQAQDNFTRTARALGKQEIDAAAESNRLGIVCVGRPYNTTDSGMNLDLPRKMAAMGYPVLYMDMLPLDPDSIRPTYANMYWEYGRQILSAAAFIAASPHWFGVFFSNFMCGPDSYLLGYFKACMKQAGKPYLCLQMDGHGADAGYLTRIEAALETFHAWARIPMPSGKTTHALEPQHD